MANDNFVEIEVERIIKETEKAFLCEVGGGEEIWVPKSQIEGADKHFEDDEGVTMAVTEWWAKKNNLMD